jgi:hypothetical protein
VKRSTQTLLYHLLPAVFWLLAIGGTLVPALLPFTFRLSPFTYYSGYWVAAIVLIVILFIGRIKRHASSVEECFLMAIFFGIASYWLPTVVFLTILVWAYLIYQNLFSGRSFLATFLGYAVVAIWAAVFIFFGWIANPWAHFFAIENALGWIPLGAVLLAWLGSTIVRQTLRVR